jgi:hypothetical protein
MALLASMGAVTGVMALGALLTVLAPTERPSSTMRFPCGTAIA